MQELRVGKLQRFARNVWKIWDDSVLRQSTNVAAEGSLCLERSSVSARDGRSWIHRHLNSNASDGLGLMARDRNVPLSYSSFVSYAGPIGPTKCSGKCIPLQNLGIPQFLSCTSRRGYSSGFRSPGVDIGARARRNQARRFWNIVISGSFVAGFIIVVLNTFQENMMFYITPSQALEKYYIDPSKNKFRLGGLVLEGSVYNAKSATDMEFVVTDLANEILVRYRGALPDLFREGHSVVAEGYLRPLDSYPGRPDAVSDRSAELAEKAKHAGCYFTAVEVLAKHDEKYMPKEVAAAIEKNKVAQEAVLLAQPEPVAQLPVALESDPTSGVKRKSIPQTPATAQKYEIS